MTDLLVLSKGENSASTRYRAMQFAERFELAGIRARHMSIAGGADNYLQAIRAAKRVDVVLVLRKTLPWPLLWALRRAAKRLVFDFDDAIFSNSDGSPSRTRMSRFSAMVACCDQVSAGNAFLLDMAKQFNSQVTLVPTCVDTARYAASSGESQAFFDVVWIGSSSTRKYLEEAVPALQLASRQIPGFRLKIIADFSLDGVGFPVMPVPWRLDTEAMELAASQVGIAPMRDDDWSRGKCALKVLQYMAAGLPVVSSPAGVNAEAVVPGATGFLVRGDAEWSEALVSLAADAAMCGRMGHAGRLRVEKNYSADVVFSRLLGVVLGCAGGKG